MPEQVERHLGIIPYTQPEPEIDDHARDELHRCDDRTAEQALDKRARLFQFAELTAEEDASRGKTACKEHGDMGSAAKNQFQQNIETAADTEHTKYLFNQRKPPRR